MTENNPRVSVKETSLVLSLIMSEIVPVVMSVVKRTIERDLSAMKKMGALIRNCDTSSQFLITSKSHYCSYTFLCANHICLRQLR